MSKAKFKSKYKIQSTQGQIVVRKMIEQLSKKSLGKIAQLEEPSDEQKEWVLFRLSHPETWPNAHETKIGDAENPK